MIAGFSGLLFLIALAVAVLLGGLTYVGLNRPHLRIAERAKAEAVATLNHNPVTEGDARKSAFAAVFDLLARIADHLPVYNAEQRDKFTTSLRSAGLRHPMALRLFIIIKFTVGLVGALAGWFLVTLLAASDETLMPTIAILGGLVAGLILPEILLDWAARRRREAIHLAIPDALDLMVICTNAGYSLSATLRRVSTEFVQISPALASELALTADDIALRADPMAGLRNLAERTAIPVLGAMVTTLIQAQRYGTPITQSLKTLAKSERRARILAMEEKGAKLSTKITIPMMILILPAVLILAGGPAFLRIMEVFGK